MDNITHSLIGVAVGEWALQRASATDPKSEKKRRRFWLATSILGNNFPDLDILYTSITPAPLGSLLHHRGHTHTLVGLIPQWILIFGLFWLFRKMLRLDTLSRKDWTGAGLLCTLGLLLHIFADSWNSYGVHPFFPFWNGWVYGDAIFIVEPFLWIVLSVMILLTGQTVLRIVPLILSAALLAFGVYQKYIGFLGLIILVGVFSLLLAVYRSRRSSIARVSVMLIVAFVAFHFSASRWIKSKLSVHEPTGILDIALTPLPANPLCWFVIQISVREKFYEVKRGLLSLWPEVMPADNCPDLGRIRPDTKDVMKLDGTEILWTNSSTTSLSEFEILKSRCDLRAWMRFARVPFIKENSVFDLRFSRGGMRNFTGYKMGQEVACPPNIPPWIPPRWDVIQALDGEAWFQ
jgi:inner membrane protein